MDQPRSGRQAPQRRRRYVPAIGPRLGIVLFVVLGLFALLAVNSVYLASITVLEWVRDATYQDYFYQWMFLLHLVLGLLLILPVVIFGIIHMRNAWSRPNRWAVRMGVALFSTALVLLFTGVLLTRFGFFEVNDPAVRSTAYWLHVLSPLLLVWLFILHRLAGRRIRWKVGLRWAGVAAGFALLMVVVHAQDPRQWNVAGPESGEQYFFPSLSRTATGNFIPARAMMMEDYCVECHEDTNTRWEHSMHHLSSFNNPAYLFSVRETRKVAYERDGNVQAARFCAGCHDPVPFFSGAFDDPDFDDVNHPTAAAGITCTSCHAITNVNSPRGNADYTIEEPVHYPFAFSASPFLQAVNHQLVKAKPEFHKKTFLKPLHKSTEFCGTCHKVHLPSELNDYKWLRGQNHYDAFLLSGVSGHGITSFYYPPKAKRNCAECHMPLKMAENDFGGQAFDDSGERKLHDHMFPAANTAVTHMLGMPDSVNDDRYAFLSGTLRVDIFGLKEGGSIDAPLTAPIRPEIPALRPGQRYLIETVIRTLKVGHLFTQGTSDSNEIWLDVSVSSGDRVLGRSGAMDGEGRVDPWSHFINAYVLDRNGNRIDRRNAQDIFVPLYNHQIPPGAADVVHYSLDVPRDVTGPVTVEVKLQYRKFDATYMKYIEGDSFVKNDLPVVTIAADRVTFPLVNGSTTGADSTGTEVAAWERWNDYGIGLLRKGSSGSSKGELRQATEAFTRVEALGRPDGPLNLARVCLKEGRLDEAADALHRAAAFDPPAPPWSVAWFTGLVNEQNGYLDEAIRQFKLIVNTQFEDARARGFDFSRDYRVLNEIGVALFERSRAERGAARKARRESLLAESRDWFLKTLKLDPENVTAHYNLALIYAQLGDTQLAARHRALHMKYKPDDNASERTVAMHRRRNAAADHAAEAVVIYDLQRSGAVGLASPKPVTAPHRLVSAHD